MSSSLSKPAPIAPATVEIEAANHGILKYKSMPAGPLIQLADLKILMAIIRFQQLRIVNKE